MRWQPWPVNHLFADFTGEVVETRNSRLQSEMRKIFGPDCDPWQPTVAISETQRLPNPLPALAALLNQPRPVHLAAVHGDFNLENILIETETNSVSLIDFADAREDHVLHDLLRLESEVITQLLPEILHQQFLPPVQTLAQLFDCLHQAAFASDPAQFAPVDPALRKVWILLNAVRRAARQYFERALGIVRHCLANDHHRTKRVLEKLKQIESA